MLVSRSPFRLTSALALLAGALLLAACGEEIPSVPGGLNARAGDGSVVLSWLPAPQADVKLYNIYWGASPDKQDETQAVVHPTTNVTLYGLQDGTVYYFAVDAENFAGQRSARSALVSATPTAPVDQSAPSIQSSTPLNADTGVNPTTPLTLHFTEPMDVTSVKVSCDPAANLGTPVWSSNNTVATFSAALPFAGSTHYSCTVTGKGANGLALTAPLSVAFTTSDITAPYVVDSSPSDEEINVDPSATLYVIFSEPMDQSFNPVLVDVSPDFPWNQGFDGTGKILAIQPSYGRLDWGTTYSVTIGTSAKDLAGNALQQPYTFRFTTSYPPYPPYPY